MGRLSCRRGSIGWPSAPGQVVACATLRYEDWFSRWTCAERGKQGFQAHLKQALDNDVPLRLIIASVDDPEERALVMQGHPASDFKKSFDPRKDLIGEVVVLTADRHVMDFFGARRPATTKKQ